MNRKDQGGNDGEGRLWRIGSRLFLGLIVVVLALTAMQCTVKKPEAPEWNTQLTVPLLNRTYGMVELIEKAGQEGLTVDGDDIVYSMSYDIDTIAVDGANMSVPDITYLATEVIGPISLSAPVTAPVSTAISDIGSLSAAIPGPLPAVSFSVQQNLPAITSFTSATVSSGQMLVIVSNQLGVNLDTLNILMFDVGNNRLIDAYSFPGGLSKNSVDTAVFVLDGKTLSNQLQFRGGCHNEADVVLSASNLELSTIVEFSNGLTVSSATAQVPALNPVIFSQQTYLDDPANTDVVHRATLNSGSLDMTVTNNTPLDATVTVSVPDLDSAGVKFQQVRFVGAGASSTISQNITGYALMPADLTAPQDVNIDVTITGPGSGTSYVTVNETDDFIVDAALANLTFESVTGVFAPAEASLDPVVEQIDVSEGFDGFALTSAIVTLEVDNSVNFPGYLILQLSNGAGKNLFIIDSIQAGTPGSATTTTISVIDSSFLSPLPDSIIVSGTATFGDGINAGTLDVNDYLFARVTITAPIEAVISETTLDTEIESESVDQADIDLITDHVLEARFIYTITNHLPLGASVQILLGGDTTSLVGQDNQVIPDYTLGGNGELSITAAPTIAGIVPPDSVNSSGQQTITISSSDLDFLRNDPLFIGSVITLDGSNGQTVKLTSNDYITITGYLEIDYRMDGEF